MGTSQTALKSTQRKKTREDVGEFGMKLVAKILDGEISPRGDKTLADVMSKRHKFRVEVKTCSNKRSFGLWVYQMEMYRKRPAKGIRDSLYALVDYRVGERHRDEEGKSRSISGLARARGRKGRLRYVAEHIQEVYLLDLAVVESLLFVCPIVNGYYPGKNRRNEPCLRLGREDLRAIFRDSSFLEMMSKLSMHPSGWHREQRSIESVTSVDGQPYLSTFKLISVLRSHTNRKLLPTIAHWT